MKALKIDIGAEDTFTADDLRFMIAAIATYKGDYFKTTKCMRLLEAALENLRPRRKRAGGRIG